MALILVTGASGQLGNEIRVLSKNYSGYEFLFTDLDELDITDESAVNDFVGQSAPDWIINCAAYNFVDKAETEEEKALSLIHISEPTRLLSISYAVFCLKKKKLQ